jgi:acetyl esterase/lipase
LRPHLLYLADPPAAVRYTGSDTIDVGYQALHRWTTVSIADYDRFVAEHPHFVAYALGSGWLLDKLRDDHATLNEIGREAGATVYAVSIAR